MKPEIAHDIENLIEYLQNQLDGTSLPENVLEAINRVEAWLATYEPNHE